MQGPETKVSVSEYNPGVDTDVDISICPVSDILYGNFWGLTMLAIPNEDCMEEIAAIPNPSLYTTAAALPLFWTQCLPANTICNLDFTNA